MPARFLLAYHPSRIEAEHPRLIEDLLELAESGRQEAVDAIIEMLEDFYRNGRNSRFLKKLRGVRVWELKTRARGGMKGGARVYLYLVRASEGEAVEEALLVNAEVKAGDAPSMTKLKEAAEIIQAFEQGVPVVRRRTA